ncbi:gluconate 2-dehydrogenase subunit 3 family protein [Metallumcola ferriviriculae]|uniref:Gluconate 2-dehydrogenase subunit 3 family protein n=1 Tax=Metallumcola ferriviriculae TaxID=3039180 RepID=A0AAU0UJ56_9FIRM|nr:gluconate 2-dehydrogenase subunit 3 family protein [Desulfitibacteraceae bacterium MK1]
MYEKQRTRYKGFNVLDEKKEWDQHTEEIVLKRLGPFAAPKFLLPEEKEMLKAIASHLIYDDRKEILEFVINHTDESLTSPVGEGERKPDAPPLKDLIRWGLKALDNAARGQFDCSFVELNAGQQFEMVAALQKAKAYLVPDWQQIPQKELFKKLASLIVSAYYAHPTIWSEIGYAGPAYPRGYVRLEFGLTDPWEAERNEE